jgi:hypothetical protein
MDKLSDQRLHELELGVTTLRQGEIVAMAREIFELRAQTRDLDLLHEKFQSWREELRAEQEERGWQERNERERALIHDPAGDPDPVGGS